MVTRRQRLLLGLFALLVAAWLVLQVATGAETGLLYLAPALLMLAPLFAGRYVGEKQLVAVGRTAGHDRPRPVAMPRGHVRVMERGGRLVASALAKRPPPHLLPSPTA